MPLYSIWLMAALLALIIELLTGSFFLFVLSGALTISGLISWLGGSPILTTVIGSASGLIGIILLRRYQQKIRPKHHAPYDLDYGKTVRLLTREGAWGRVTYRGTEWDARLLDSELSPGEYGYITGHEGNCLVISSRPLGKP